MVLKNGTVKEPKRNRFFFFFFFFLVFDKFFGFYRTDSVSSSRLKRPVQSDF